MLQKLKKREKGFTIIEVLIVLAIAGLILLIVFLAVPALQRSSRNTQRKNDAAAIASAIANYINNNGGTTPTKVSDSGVNALLVGDPAVNTNSETARLGYYQTGSTGAFAATDGKMRIDIANGGPIGTIGVGSETATKVSTESVIIDTGYTCDSTNTGIGTANSRTVAIFYATENGSATGSLQCVEQ